MKILRITAIVLLKTMLLFSVSLFIFSTIALSLINKPDRLKTWVNDSGVYVSIADGFKNQLLQENQDATKSQKLIFDKAINNALRPEIFRNFSELAIDSTYAWLNSEVQIPEFSLDFAKIKQDIANDITDQILKRLKKLPNCTASNPPTSTDIFTINCIPPGTNIELEVSKLKETILSDQVNQDIPLDANNIKLKTAQGEKPFYESLKSIRDYYRWIKRLPLITLIIFGLLAGLIFIVSDPKIRGLRTVALAVIPNAVLYLGVGIFLPNLLRMSLNSALSQSGDEFNLNEPLQKITEDLANFIGKQLIIIGVVLLVIGIILLVIYKQKSKNTATNIKPNGKNLQKPTNNTIH
jgi:hypothetical protein